jgi:acyl-CoA dehydrogenase
MQTADWRPRLESLFAEFRRRQADVARSGDKPDRVEVARAWHAELVDHQLAAPGWPREVGGLELSLEDQLDYYRMTTAFARSCGVEPSNRCHRRRYGC